MKFFLVVLLFPSFSFAQTDIQLLQGLWVRVKAQMKDGSRIIDRKGCGMGFRKYDFSQNGFVYNGDDILFRGYRMQYKKVGDTMLVGGPIYRVLSLTKDTLKLSPVNVKGGDSKTPVYFFKKVSENSAPAVATYNAGLKDSVYQVNNELFPQSTGVFTDFAEGITGKYETGKLKVSFIIDKKGHFRDYTVLEADSISNIFAKKIGNAFARLSWQPAIRNGFPVNSQATIILKCGLSTDGSQLSATLDIEYPFLPKAPYTALDRDEVEAERDMFKDASNQFNSHNYAKAVELLSKCIEMDNIDLDAYYMRADAYVNLGKQADACKDWTTLAGLGQTDARKKLVEHCKN